METRADMVKVLSWLAIIPARIHIGPRSTMGMPYGDGDAHGQGHSGRGSGRGEDYGTYDGDGMGNTYEELMGYGDGNGDGARQTTVILY